MRFEWDEAKDVRNQAKHGVAFEDAVMVFRDPGILVELARADRKTGEPRWMAIGVVPEKPAVLVVVYADRTKTDGDEKTIRIISARAADKRERRRYSQQTAQ